MPRESVATVEVRVEGFHISSPMTHSGAEDDEVKDTLAGAADDIATDIGMALSSLGGTCVGGIVTLTLDGITASNT